MLLFRTSILVSRPFTFSLLAHPIPKTLTWHLLRFSSYFPRLTLLFGIAPTLVPFFFIPGNSLPILQVQPARPGPLSSSCSQGSGMGFDFSFPPFSALGAGLLIAA